MGDSPPSAERRRWLSGERLASIASGFVASLALVISIYTVHIQRQQLKAQVWPHAQLVGRVGDGDTPNGITLTLKNRGVGPAKIKGFQVKAYGQLAHDWFDYLDIVERKLGAHTIIDIGKTSSPKDEVLSATEDMILFQSNDPHVVELLEGLRQSEITLCYCSVLDECWQSTFPKDDDSVEVASCPKDPFYFRPTSDEGYEAMVRNAGGSANAPADAGAAARDAR